MNSENHLNKGKLDKKLLIFIGVGIICLILGIFFESNFHHDNYSEKDIVKFENKLHKKELLLESEFESLNKLFESGSSADVLNENSDKYQKLSEQGLFIFYYEEDIIKYWSDHTIPLRNRWRLRYRAPFQVMRNADYVSVIKETEEGKLLGLIEIRTHYALQNEFLENKFSPDFNLNPDVKIEILESVNTLPVHNSKGRYLFSLDFTDVSKSRDLTQALSVVCYLLFFLLFFAILCRTIKNSSGKSRLFALLFAIAIILTGSIILLKFRIPQVLFDSALFQSELFASRFFDSLGHLMVLAFDALMIAVIFNRYLNFEAIQNLNFRKLLSASIFVFATVWFVGICHVIEILVIDSNISFETYRVTSFSIYTFVGLFTISLFFAVFALLADIGVKLLFPFTLRNIAVVLLPLTISMILFLILARDFVNMIDFILLVLIVASQIYLRYSSVNGIQFSRIIFLLLFVSIFVVNKLHIQNRLNTDYQKEVELVKLSSEHDPVAEMLFSEISMAIRNDSILSDLVLVNGPFIDIDEIFRRLQRNYFSGYWTKYDILITVCTPEDSVYLQVPDDEWLHCYTFFGELMQSEGIQISNSDFYFLDNLNGRISYLASVPFFNNEMERTLYLELDSKIISEELGYPELLLDDDFTSFTNSRFSYAKYNGGQLITQSGDFPYRRTSDHYTQGEEMFEKIMVDKYDHMIYNVDEHNTIIVGTPSVLLIDNLISFSYVFAFYFILLSLFFIIFSIRDFSLFLNWNFKNKIQYSMAGILFLTFIFICSGTIYFIVKQYRDKNNDNLRNTMRSIYIELIHKVEYEEDLRNWESDSYYNLDELLRKFSNVFYSDINLYDGQGNILASSRAEIFNQQLLSTRMNRFVFENLAIGNVSEYIHTEQIGELSYLSAYVPLLNSENRLLAYLNLPYFTHASALTQDVTNLVVAVLNIYVILLLVILFVSVVLADRITQPLRVIQNRIAHVSLSKKNEKIVYERSDEIQGLVEEYNYMVDEIERSAGLLAQSERESAWREMAKQIAHEIKNPLTPMKLNVQHLQRTYGEKGDKKEMIDRISKTLVEQIDSLSSIANEFSDFAKMPKAKSKPVNLVSKLKNALQLFETNKHVDVTLELGDLNEVYVFADKEQLMRVFINLIKNSIQSIPEKRKGKIEIKLEIEGDTDARVTISDNGKGIPEDIKEKLFHPNFTTKSGGMGMGLAIVSNIIKSFNGDIWYETLLGKGTRFHIRLPIYKEKS